MTEMTRNEVDDVLDGSLIGRLCMADGAGRPYAIPLPFSWHDGALYLRIPLAGRKGAILAENDQVCFEVDQYTETLDDYCSVLVEGRLVDVADLDEKAAVKSVTDAKYNRLRRGHRPGHGRATPLANLPLRKLVVRCLSGRKKHDAPVAVGSLELTH
jgi:nitroimidazol reductase NimA-like FMN-containing flavoprotein (pyridoxamine 5'-phosphate oxidase superfamily)